MKFCFCPECDEYYELQQVTKTEPAGPHSVLRDYHCPKGHLTNQPAPYEVLVLHKLDTIIQDLDEVTASKFNEDD